MLVVVVGPSGAGKDTLLAGAKQTLADDPRFTFVRRVVTRPAKTGSEDHDVATETSFSQIEAAGGFALSWAAHGLHYGVPSAIKDIVAEGRVAVLNGSRAALPETLRRFPDARIVLITADPQELARRLAGRGRESAEDIAARLRREVPNVPAGAVIVDNSTTAEEGVARFVAALKKLDAPITATDPK